MPCPSTTVLYLSLNAGNLGRGVSKTASFYLVSQPFTHCWIFLGRLHRSTVPCPSPNRDRRLHLAQYVIIESNMSHFNLHLGATGSRLTCHPSTWIASTTTTTIRKCEYKYLPDSINHSYLLSLAPTLARTATTANNHKCMVTAEELGLDDLRVLVSSYPLATIGLYDCDFRQSSPLFSSFCFHSPSPGCSIFFPRLWCSFTSVSFAELPCIDSIAGIRGALVWPFPVLLNLNLVLPFRDITPPFTPAFSFLFSSFSPLHCPFRFSFSISSDVRCQ